MNYKEYLDRAYEYASKNTTCIKVAVGSLFLTNKGDQILSCNKSYFYSCKDMGYCYKLYKTGVYESCEDTRYACKSIHSEIGILNSLDELNYNPSNGILFVTRYPCLNCARAIAEAGIKNIVYGGRDPISDQVKNIFDEYKILYTHCPECDYEYK